MQAARNHETGEVTTHVGDELDHIITLEARCAKWVQGYAWGTIQSRSHCQVARRNQYISPPAVEIL